MFRVLHDVIEMNPNDSEGNQSSGNYSVSKKLVYFGLPIHADKWTLPSVCCIVHGAMLAVSKMRNTENGLLFRCEACNNGAILK
jgi:hypothetical protein